MRSISRLLVLMSLSLSTSALAVGENLFSMDATSGRSINRLGGGLSYGQPYPSVLGLNLSYNFTEYLRATAGWGSIEVTTGLNFDENGMTSRTATATTIALGAQAMMPGWSLSPTVGLQVANISFSGEGEFEVQGIDSDGTFVYIPVGVDYQGDNGFHLAAGYNLPLGQGDAAFYISTGWFVDYL